MKKTASMMTPEERERAVEVIGNTVLMLEEGYGFWQIAEKLKLDNWQVLDNINEILYTIRNGRGRWNYFKQLFVK